MPKAKKEMSMLKRFTIKYSFEFVVIILGILISLLLEQKRQNEIEINRKNNTIKQLINVIDEDINQIQGFIYLQNYSLNSCNLIFDNLNNKNTLYTCAFIFKKEFRKRNGFAKTLKKISSNTVIWCDQRSNMVCYSICYTTKIQ